MTIKFAGDCAEERKLLGLRKELLRQVLLVNFVGVRIMVGRHHEVLRTLHRHLQPGQIGKGQSSEAPDCYDAFHIPNAKAGNSQQRFLTRFVHVDRKEFTIAESPRELWIFIQGEIAIIGCRQLIGFETVEAQEPVGLVESMLPDQGYLGCGEEWVRVRNRAESGIVRTAELVFAVKRRRLVENDGIRGVSGADNKLRALSGPERSGANGRPRWSCPSPPECRSQSAAWRFQFARGFWRAPVG